MFRQKYSWSRGILLIINNSITLYAVKFFISFFYFLLLWGIIYRLEEYIKIFFS